MRIQPGLWSLWENYVFVPTCVNALLKVADIICIQLMDGLLTFLENARESFSTPLPDFILPGPMVYLTQTDSLVFYTAGYALESYKLF